MVAERKIIDVENVPGLASFAEEVTTMRKQIVLRKQGKEFAIIVPSTDSSSFSPGRAKTPEDRQAFLASAGGWQGIVDEDMMEEIYNSRRISLRPLIGL
jgi:hypothetical protein